MFYKDENFIFYMKNFFIDTSFSMNSCFIKHLHLYRPIYIILLFVSMTALQNRLGTVSFPGINSGGKQDFLFLPAKIGLIFFTTGILF
jgi:hypothetical protein